MTVPPRPVHTHVWDGTTVPAWLDGLHHLDGDQLVIRTPDGDAQPRPGWTIVGWTDGTVTLASPAIAEREYGPDGVYAQLDRAETEVQRLGDWCRAVGERATAAEASADRYHGELAVNEADRVAAVRRAETAEAAIARVRRAAARRSFMAGPSAIDAIRVADVLTALDQQETE